MRIGLDAMGGDYAPQVTVEGAHTALSQLSGDTTLVLFGDRAALQAADTYGVLNDPRIEVVPTTEVIAMGDHPVKAFAQKSDSSIVVGFRHLCQGDIAGFASAGSTGAMMVGCMQAVGQIEGVIRPAIATAFKTATGNDVLLLDVGLNADCKPEVLAQYGIIGSIYARETLKIANPRVALLNIGEEPEKGNLLTKATYPLMAEKGAAGAYNFVGNIEGKHLLTSDIADVIVCDGFSGNTLLKTIEGFHHILQSQGISAPFVEGLNYENVGGTPVLGINSTVIIGHGCSTAKAIANMILLTERAASADMVSQFKKAFNS
ncbi:phosphate acyltransferase [Millionella massiliensis]|uniref:phosphate acyltransferase n=1 Tax=Millionella massiliensis TaxID=1871023 RepID=UPI0024B8468E|nr:phosphate--acyl-ACP acyltransferase [Millionella massiliensis]